MKKWIIAACVVAVTAMTTFLAHRLYLNTVYEFIEDGIRHDNSNLNAPKVIDSTDITGFICYFSTKTLVEPGRLGRNEYNIEAVLKDGIVYGVYHKEYPNEGKSRKVEFETNLSFMEKLQSIIAEHDLAQYNGHDYFVSGLPDDFGAKIIVDYASGERIYAKDNQDNFLSIDAMCALKDLFSAYAAEAE